MYNSAFGTLAPTEEECHSGGNDKVSDRFVTLNVRSMCSETVELLWDLSAVMQVFRVVPNK